MVAASRCCWACWPPLDSCRQQGTPDQQLFFCHIVYVRSWHRVTHLEEATNDWQRQELPQDGPSWTVTAAPAARCLFTRVSPCQGALSACSCSSICCNVSECHAQPRQPVPGSTVSWLFDVLGSWCYATGPSGAAGCHRPSGRGSWAHAARQLPKQCCQQHGNEIVDDLAHREWPTIVNAADVSRKRICMPGAATGDLAPCSTTAAGPSRQATMAVLQSDCRLHRTPASRRC